MDTSTLLYIKIIVEFVLKLLSYFKKSEETEAKEV